MEASTALISRRIYASLGTGALAVGALAYVGIADPHRHGSVFPPCPFKLLTGWNCPACGGLRMTHDLLHGSLSAAVADNVFLLAGIPMLLAWVLWRRHTGKPLMTRAAFVMVAAAALIWTIVRNLPGFPLVPTLYSG
ncbi:MAG: hypothetical protein QOE41_4322 [Mycobacterium sp.]|jgi:hypothetical protein|nr:rane protein [Mycobacterium sp.]MDT5135011.1 hypothetical protein [Mycobacterium sp.]